MYSLAFRRLRLLISFQFEKDRFHIFDRRKTRYAYLLNDALSSIRLIFRFIHFMLSVLS